MKSLLLEDQLQLVIDDAAIESRSGLTRRIGSVVKFPGNPVIAGSEAHDAGGMFMFGTLIHDEGRFRLWYGAQPPDDPAGGWRFCYAESDDGIRWRKPRLGLVEHLGSTDNNILLPQMPGLPVHNLSVAKCVADVDPARRYVATLYTSIPGEHPGLGRAHRVIHSADGLHWSAPDPARPTYQCMETGALLFDPSRPDCIDINKLHHSDENPTLPFWMRPRCIAAAWGPDPFHVGSYHVVLKNDPAFDAPTDEMYAMGAFRYGGHYVGLLRVYHNTREENGGTDQCIDIQLAASRDGLKWQRVCPGQTLIPIGEPGAWDFARIALGNGPPARIGDQMRIYYCGQPTLHTSKERYRAKIGFASLRPDGFCSLDAGEEVGTLITRPFVVSPHGEICVNVDVTSGGGSLRAALVGEDWKPISGYDLADSVPIEADSLAAPLRWRGSDPGAFPRGGGGGGGGGDGGDGGDGGARVRLKLELRRAKLYSWKTHER